MISRRTLMRRTGLGVIAAVTGGVVGNLFPELGALGAKAATTGPRASGLLPSASVAFTGHQYAVSVTRTPSGYMDTIYASGHSTVIDTDGEEVRSVPTTEYETFYVPSGLNPSGL